jgi:hypothetical protein
MIWWRRTGGGRPSASRRTGAFRQVRFDDAALTAGTEIRVSLVLPGGAIIRCIGHVTTATGQGFALKLDLDAAARTLMRASAGRPMSPK